MTAAADWRDELHIVIEQLKLHLRTDLTSRQIVNLVIDVAHGLTAMHLANELRLPLGQGRFGSLIPAARSVLETAFMQKG